MWEEVGMACLLKGQVRPLQGPPWEPPSNPAVAKALGCYQQTYGKALLLKNLHNPLSMEKSSSLPRAFTPNDECSWYRKGLGTLPKETHYTERKQNKGFFLGGFS